MKSNQPPRIKLFQCFFCWTNPEPAAASNDWPESAVGVGINHSPPPTTMIPATVLAIEPIWLSDGDGWPFPTPADDDSRRIPEARRTIEGKLDDAMAVDQSDLGFRERERERDRRWLCSSERIRDEKLHTNPIYEINSIVSLQSSDELGSKINYFHNLGMEIIYSAWVKDTGM